uniref:Uncharacterized protein n=1 Tax=Rhizophora mucronata TaxID=61149 RepID=A0A2P2Q9F8_RHIMU
MFGGNNVFLIYENILALLSFYSPNLAGYLLLWISLFVPEVCWYSAVLFCSSNLSEFLTSLPSTAGCKV